MKLLWIGLKDLSITVRDRKALLILVAMPMILISILGMALAPVFSGSPELARVDVAFVDNDQGQVSRELKEAFTSKRLRELVALKVMDEAEARRKVKMGDLAAAIVLPKGFTENIRAGKRSYCQA